MQTPEPPGNRRRALQWATGEDAYSRALVMITGPVLEAQAAEPADLLAVLEQTQL